MILAVSAMVIPFSKKINQSEVLQRTLGGKVGKQNKRGSGSGWVGSIGLIGSTESTGSIQSIDSILSISAIPAIGSIRPIGRARPTGHRATGRWAVARPRCSDGD